jgi:DegV family protein with EDD domain
MSVRIVTDSTCDLPAEIISEFGISVMPLYINVGDKGFLDGVEISRQEFYVNLPNYAVHPTTAAPSPEKFRDLYESLAEQGANEILSIHISISLSATLDSARRGAQETKSVPVTVFDSRQLSLGMGFLVETAAKLAKEGHTVKEIIPVLENQISRTRVFAALDTLEFLKRSGRMSGIMAGLGSFLQLKPILTMYEGKPGAERVRTRERATRRVLDHLRGMGALERVAIIHSNAPDRVAEIRERASSYLPADKVLAVDITPVLGAHIGPGIIGFAAVAKLEKTR